MKTSLLASLILLLSATAHAQTTQTIRAGAALAPVPGQHVVVNVTAPDTGAGLSVRPAEPTTFLGVSTSRVDPTLTEQLGLQREVGLVVSDVVADSPANGLLKRHDILLKLNDQILINVEQLGVLVRSYREGDEVTLTYVRAGKQETVKVKLAQRLAPRIASIPQAGFDVWQQFVPASAATFSHGTVQVGRVPGAMAGEEVNRTLSLARPNVTISAGPAPIARLVDVGRSNLVFSDEAGSLELQVTDGKKELVAKDPAGTVLFSGPINTDEERKAMPESVRLRFEQMEGIDALSFSIGEDFPPGDVRVITPRAEGIRLERARRPAPSLRLL